MAQQLEPWGPISTVLYDIGSSDFVEKAIGCTGVAINWPILDEKDTYSNGTRIRAYKPAINSAYSALENEKRVIFAENIAKYLLSSRQNVREKLSARLNDIGWTISEDGKLGTQDALLSEQFFPAGTPHDAYVAIKEILQRATNQIVIVDPYVGGTLFSTISAMNASKLGKLTIQLVTVAKNLKPDFRLEASKFCQQHSTVALEIRHAPDFHDRFIVIDDIEHYHIGASIKDAGSLAFMISRLQDEPIIKLLKRYISDTWNSATPIR